YVSGDIQYLPGQLIVHPLNSGAFSVVRFVATSSDSFTITAGFQVRDRRSTTTDVHVLKNGVSLFADAISGFGPGSNKAFTATTSLVAGDTLDFVVGNGQNGFTQDSTSLAVTISGTGTVA